MVGASVNEWGGERFHGFCGVRYEASGQSVETRADMYGVYVRAVTRSVVSARARLAAAQAAEKAAAEVAEAAESPLRLRHPKRRKLWATLANSPWRGAPWLGMRLPVLARWLRGRWVIALSLAGGVRTDASCQRSRSLPPSMGTMRSLVETT